MNDMPHKVTPHHLQRDAYLYVRSACVRVPKPTAATVARVLREKDRLCCRDWSCVAVAASG